MRYMDMIGMGTSDGRCDAHYQSQKSHAIHPSRNHLTPQILQTLTLFKYEFCLQTVALFETFIFYRITRMGTEAFLRFTLL